MRIFTFLALFIIGIAVGIIIDNYVIDKKHMEAQKAAEVYYDMLLTLNGIGTYTIRNPFVIRTPDSLPVVMGLISPSTCFSCIKDQLSILERFVSDKKVAGVIFLSPYRDSREQIDVVNKFKSYSWVIVNPVPDTNFFSMFGNVGKFGNFYYPVYLIGGGKIKTTLFFASLPDTSLFKGWLEQTLK
ncbi:hypothetical protein [Candidatus Kryptobacter tengchongensis]|uniref:Uncharacterized protein n=1 Tax=Kryptobacter tengchongensis TaxID=1643429 RepID=A0A916LKQ2_KRYT1|nr:hypothetical protein [Candidatus Kryptobacter tengchongensis]CUT02278.1 hypothetical protein JGI25_01038 [Candidatus Kryptobacter tengchongensis]